MVEKNRFLNYVPSPKDKKNPTEKEFNNWKNEKDFAIWLDGKNIPNSELDKYTTKDIAYFAGSFVHKNARTKTHPQLHQFSLYTLSYFDKNLKNSHLKFSGKELRITLMNKKEEKGQAVETTTTQDNEIYSLGEVSDKPSYPSGIEEFYKFFSTNYKVPGDFKGNGKIYITFMVETDGSLSEFKILRDLGFGTGEEAIRVLKISPKWIPGKEDGKDVRMQFSLPIAIQAK